MLIVTCRGTATAGARWPSMHHKLFLLPSSFQQGPDHKEQVQSFIVSVSADRLCTNR